MNRTESLLIECPVCRGHGCEACDEGRFELTVCPHEYLGEEMKSVIRLSIISGNGSWPVAGGLLDQSPWFLNLHQALNTDVNLVLESRHAKR